MDCYNETGEPSGSSSPTIETDSNADSFKCRKPDCERTFTTASGRGLHESKDHKNWYDEKLSNTKHKKTPWTSEELRLLARQEAILMREGVRFINQSLQPFFPTRTLESIKGQWKSAKYKSLVEEFTTELEEQQNLDPIDEGSSDPEYHSLIDEPSTPETIEVDPMVQYFESLIPLDNPDFNSNLLNNICKNALTWPKIRIAENLVIYLLRTLPYTKNKGRNPARMPNQQQTLTRRQKRRLEYTITQKSWAKDRCKCIKTIIESTSNNQNNIPNQNIMVPFWTKIMTCGENTTPGSGFLREESRKCHNQ